MNVDSLQVNADSLQVNADSLQLNADSLSIITTTHRTLQLWCENKTVVNAVT